MRWLAGKGFHCRLGPARKARGAQVQICFPLTQYRITIQAILRSITGTVNNSKRFASLIINLPRRRPLI